MDEAIANPAVAGHNRPRNPGVALEPAWFESVAVNASAVERRTATLAARRSVKKEYQAAWLVRALTCIDLTTLAGDDTPGRVRRLCAKARRPLTTTSSPRSASPTIRRRSARSASTRPWSRRRSGRSKARAFRSLRSPTGFPAGLTPLKLRLAEIHFAVGRGRERDRHRHHPRPCAGPRLERALRRGAAMREACGRRISRPSSPPAT